MKLRASLTVDPGEASPPSASFVEVTGRRGRPRKLYRLRVRGPEDVEAARRSRLAVYLLTSERVAELGTATRFRPHLLVAQDLDSAVDTDLPRIVFRHGASLDDPRIEDLVVALLAVDPLSARHLAVTNRRFIDPPHLAERVVQEGCVRRATLVGLQYLAPEIPLLGPTLPEEMLKEHDRGHTVTGVRA